MKKLQYSVLRPRLKPDTAQSFTDWANLLGEDK
jgi:hypothetical protein